MGRITKISLDAAQEAALEKGYRDGKSHAFRRRCQMVLLKSQGRSSKDIASVVGGCQVVVNNWVKRYQEEGLAGLETKAGRGRAPILDSPGDLEAVRAAVGRNRQRLSVVAAELETQLGKSFCPRTLNRFVKKTVRAISESGAVPAIRQTRTPTVSKSSACRSSRGCTKPG